ncbi:Uncharacterized conserved protein [Tistlia consotensis]|uniref:Uncharacterized conserved protein n=1 Tax=Tistlia consotensis USBA 355 TaxID=560819 RepID=A0A1Y6B242_9PROT|nr:GFA family protein [Tistlia consotensis]SME87788.1 Uncharacterized conserved protein [Tistlia consotensis USBA 355]SNR24141.1 Uncharacterized conserved protein [Tistlia consotensis]
MTTYTGGCHCGAVRYEVELELERLVSCNCSFCAKRGTLMAFAPEEAFRLLQGEAALVDYLFNRKVIHHLFCRTCGQESFARGIRPDGVRTVAINARCLDDIDLSGLPVIEFDGRNKL